MISFTSAQWQAWVGAALWPFLRVLGLVLAEPFLGHRAVPLLAKVGVALLITVLLMPVLPAVPAVAPASAAGALVAAQQLVATAHDALLARLQEAFGDRAGRFVAIEGCATFPLALKVASTARTARTVLIGNAAQTLHPVAGQGVNLGLRDAWELAQAAARNPEQAGDATFLRTYHAARAPDRRGAVLLTDSLVRLFSQRGSGLGLIRGCGLALLDISSTLKRGFIGRMTFGG